MAAFTRIDGTDEFQHSVVGFDFMATQPGVGLVLQHVGRTVFSLDGEEIVFSSGQNNVPDPEDFQAAVCRALA